jgi:hypothetical protein
LRQRFTGLQAYHQDMLLREATRQALLTRAIFINETLSSVNPDYVPLCCQTDSRQPMN